MAVTPTRSVRIGPVWDQAKAIAQARGDNLNRIITRALEAYVRRHQDPERKTDPVP